jgi:Domain of unknown function (DUF4126)
MSDRLSIYPSPMMLFGSLIAQLPGTKELAAFLVVVCFSAGLNVYATVALLGLFSHANILLLPPQLHGLGKWYVIGTCAVLFALEFVGDKIPLFDLAWNAMQTFVRIPAAALITFAATSQLPEWQRLVATFLGALIVLAAHGGKTTARAAVTHSPEPFSNISLSLAEDAAVAFLLWYATHHLFAAAGIVLVALAVIAWMSRLVLRALRQLFRPNQPPLPGGLAAL